MYNIGDEVVYPMHGAGVVEAIEEKDIMNERKHYYVMRMPVGDVKVMIPVANCAAVGIRDVIDEATADTVIAEFEAIPADVLSNWNRRYRENMDKMRSGKLSDVAYVVKTLMLKEKMKGLSMGERKMLSSAKQILVSELVIAKKSTEEEIMNMLTNIVLTQLEETGEAQEQTEVAVSDNSAKKVTEAIKARLGEKEKASEENEEELVEA
jgi:CarD family transcriptional regulator